MSGTEPSSPTRQSFLLRRFPFDVFPATFVGVIVLGKDSGQFPVVTRFFNEARAVNIVSHPGVVGSFDYGEMPDGTAYIVMEYLEGESLSARIKRTAGPFGFDALRIGRQIGAALAAAHSKGIIHRDLKPDKITPVEKWL